jgi:hypothetical protein
MVTCAGRLVSDGETHWDSFATAPQLLGYVLETVSSSAQPSYHSSVCHHPVSCVCVPCVRPELLAIKRQLRMGTQGDCRHDDCFRAEHAARYSSILGTCACVAVLRACCWTEARRIPRIHAGSISRHSSASTPAVLLGRSVLQVCQKPAAVAASAPES